MKLHSAGACSLAGGLSKFVVVPGAFASLCELLFAWGSGTVGGVSEGLSHAASRVVNRAAARIVETTFI